MPLAVVYSLALGFEVLSKILKRQAPLSIYRVKSARARMRFDCTKAENEIGWQPRIGVASGLQETMAAERINSAKNVLEHIQESYAAKYLVHASIFSISFPLPATGLMSVCKLKRHGRDFPERRVKALSPTR